MSSKGKGTPNRILSTTKTCAYYKRMVTEPQNNCVGFKRIGIKWLRLTHFEQCKTGIGLYDDELYQVGTWYTRPLGHWQNRGGDVEITSVNPLIMAAQASYFEEVCGSKTVNDESDGAAASVSDCNDKDLEDMFGESDAGWVHRPASHPGAIRESHSARLCATSRWTTNGNESVHVLCTPMGRRIPSKSQQSAVCCHGQTQPQQTTAIGQMHLWADAAPANSTHSIGT